MALAIFLYVFLLSFHFPSTQKPILLLLANADDSLIKIQCHNANAPKTCIECLKSDNRSLNADKYEIATLVLQCLEKHADSLAANMSDFANRASHDSGSRKAYKDCKSLFSKATKELESAAKEIKNNDYDSADRFVFRARMCNLQCYGNTEKGKDVGIPIDVKSEMMVFEQLSEAVMRIIERF